MAAPQKKSTIVRIRRVVVAARRAVLPRLALAAVRAGFWLLERTAPALGARWAERLWFTIPRDRRPARRLPDGERFQAPVPGGRSVAGWSWGDGDPVYLVHGWGGSAGQLGAFVEPLVRAGYRVVAFDAPSHGASPPGPSGPRSSTILEFAAALRAVAGVHGPAHAMVGHSLGCAATAVAMRDGLAAARAVFVAPLVDATPYTHGFAARFGFGERVRTRMVARFERRFGMPLSAFDLTATAARQPAPPLLVAHDRDDRETRWADSRALARAWPEARLLTTTGLGHRRILADPQVVAEVVRFVRGEGAEHLAS
jgi:pimeloyl-ACP methyl ester carboxylesterase